MHPGDICVIVRSRSPENIGRVVRVVEIDAGMAPTTIKIAAVNPGTLPVILLLDKVVRHAAPVAWTQPWRLRKIVGEGESRAVETWCSPDNPRRMYLDYESAEKVGGLHLAKE